MTKEPRDYDSGVPGNVFETPPPDWDDESAERAAAEAFGIVGSASPLDSERDRNFRITDASGTSHVLKVSNSADDPAIIDMQTKAVLHITRAAPKLPISRVVPALDGSSEVVAASPSGGESNILRMFTFVPGAVVESTRLPIEAMAGFGKRAAEVDQALRGFFHPAAGHTLLWDIKHAVELRPLLQFMDDGARRALVTRVLDRFEARVRPKLPLLRAQVIHNDLTMDNVLVSGTGEVTGILDFGDMVHTPLLLELVVTTASLIRGRDDAFEAAGDTIGGYGSVIPLQEEETELLGDLIAVRLATTVAISSWRVRMHPENADYITGWDAGSWHILEMFDALGHEGVDRRLKDAVLSADATVATAAAVAPPASTMSDATLLQRRERVLGPALSALSYERPIQIVRGEGAWMFDAEGRAYLDAYNNVPVVGHCHPHVVEAISRQAETLNTNTRYLHEGVVELAERLTATLPDGLDTAMFVNSGSEANDLAWRLATTVTGGSGVVTTSNAYHGVTAAVEAMSPSDWLQGYRPPHAEHVPAPDGYRGPFRRDQAGWAASYAERVSEAAGELAERGFPPAVAIMDPGFTSEGIHPSPPEYLQEVLRRTHEAGALFIADEVQTGFGRFGEHLWGFQRSGIVPDFVTLGKPMGNGHPIAAVLTRRDIAERFAERGEFFSTFGGNPVACSAALAVLDVIEDDEMARHAEELGMHLREGLQTLSKEYELIGDVRGSGLLIGVELVEDRATRVPATGAARRVLNAMRERAVLIGTSGPDDNVLKIRPPLVFSRDNADLLLSTLDEVLSGL